jgi:hypothetical protein
MSLRFSASSLALLFSTFASQSARADAVIIDDPSIQQTSHYHEPGPQAVEQPTSWAPVPAPPSPGVHCGPNVYPRLNAPLYPCPVQYTPVWNGGAFITNQALAPHEMTYPHKYHAMYPPFYHKVEGKWTWTPFGMRQHENWKLEGTEVIVNYRSRFKMFSGYHPPRGI